MGETVAVAAAAGAAGVWLFFRFRGILRGKAACGGGCAACREKARREGRAACSGASEPGDASPR